MYGDNLVLTVAIVLKTFQKIETLLLKKVVHSGERRQLLASRGLVV